MTKSLLTTVCCALLSNGLAQDTPAPKPGDNDPSLEVTMKFIQDKVEAKAEPRLGNPQIEADPAKCMLTETRSFNSGELNSRKTFSFREVEKLEVRPFRDEDGNAGDFILMISMTTNTGVHERYTDKEKKKWKLWDRDNASMGWFFVDEDLANRVANAILHAAELCGGGSRPEPF